MSAECAKRPTAGVLGNQNGATTMLQIICLACGVSPWTMWALLTAIVIGLFFAAGELADWLTGHIQ